ncbi:hypothetical protein [Pseudomonas graminis]|uniref:hypothetical protein n=1 Tax=Pseudomonas graminis TaxID=158627 RepID=UPI00105B5F20|nr:hypothetical protein [Pseudomonas graminis]
MKRFDTFFMRLITKLGVDVEAFHSLRNLRRTNAPQTGVGSQVCDQCDIRIHKELGTGEVNPGKDLSTYASEQLKSVPFFVPLHEFLMVLVGTLG